MKKNAFTTRILPYLAALAAFVLVCTLYFKPQYEGMALRQGDMVQVEGMKKDIADYRAEHHEDPQWEGRMFGGMPSYLIDFDYQGRAVRQVSNALYFLQQPASYIFIAMAGFFFMLLCFGVNPWLAIVGGLAYGLSTYFMLIIEAGHITKMVALAFAPPMVGAVFLTYRKNMWLGGVLAGIFGSLEIGANHLQITYYFGFVVAALVVNEAVRAYRERLMPRFLKRTGVLLLAGALAVGSNLILLWYVNDYSKDTIRGRSELTAQEADAPRHGLDKDYVTAWSYGKMETFNLFIPNLMGGSSAGGFDEDGPVAEALAPYGYRAQAPHFPAYWGDQPGTSGPVYIGAVIVFLFVLGMFLLGGFSKWWIAGVTLLAVLLSWGHNLMWLTDLFYRYFPYYGKFRTVSMFLVVAQWGLPLVGVLALQKLWDNGIPKERFRRALKYATGIAGGIALFFLLLGSWLFDFSGPSDAQMGLPAEVLAAMRSVRASVLRAGAFRSPIFAALAAVLGWGFYRRKIGRGLFVLLAAGLVLADLAGVDRRYLNYDTFVPERKAMEIAATDADRAILQDTEPGYRVANFTVSTFQDATTSYFHRTVGGVPCGQAETLSGSDRTPPVPDESEGVRHAQHQILHRAGRGRRADRAGESGGAGAGLVRAGGDVRAGCGRRNRRARDLRPRDDGGGGRAVPGRRGGRDGFRGGFRGENHADRLQGEPPDLPVRIPRGSAGGLFRNLLSERVDGVRGRGGSPLFPGQLRAAGDEASRGGTYGGVPVPCAALRRAGDRHLRFVADPAGGTDRADRRGGRPGAGAQR